MDLSGSYPFAAPAQKVWDLLVDPDVVASCMPGCDGLEPLGDDRYRASLSMAVAAVSGQYTGTVAMVDKVPPQSFRLLVDGSGKAGFVKGEARIELVAQGDKTIVNVNGQGQVGGLVARVGQRLLGSVSKMMVDRFFACLEGKITERSG